MLNNSFIVKLINPYSPYITRYSLTGLFLTALLILLQGCGSSSTYRSSSQQDITLSNNNLESILDEARLAPAPTRDNLYLQAAELLIQQSEQQITPHALGLLFEIYPENLIPRNYAFYVRWYGQWAMENTQAVLAQQLIDSERLNQVLPLLDIDLAIPLHQLRIQYFLQTEHALRAIDEYIALGSLLIDPTEQTQNQTALWGLLQQLSPQDKQQLARQHNKQVTGWLSLLAIATAQELDLDEQIAQLESWMSRNHRHPAAQSLPDELRLLQSATRDRPEQITLLLPLSGKLHKAGEAIRDGFLAAYYQALARGYETPQVEILDTGSLQAGSADDFISLYNSAIDNGAQFIIGPLNKIHVTALKQQGDLPVPTLALNNTQEAYGQYQASDNLFLFSLNPEQEAQQVAQRARQQHHYRAMVIAPQSNWGTRVNNAFISTWLQTNNKGEAQNEDNVKHKQPLVLATALFDPSKKDYSTIIQRTLGIEDSKNRFGHLKYWANSDIEFEPRRRQDVDMIFLAARAEQARQIKPLLAFHYAGDIPVYANASIYSGKIIKSKDKDLNGTQFLISPWLLNNSSSQEPSLSNPLSQQINQQLNPSASLQNLYAMGADTWRLHSRLSLLASSPKSRLFGNTGILSINEEQKVSRQQLWAKMSRGKPLALPGTLN